MEIEREKQRQTYKICRLGFAILSFSLILAVVPSVLGLIDLFAMIGGWGMLFRGYWFRWLDIPIVWGSLLGTYLLWGRWSESGWQRRAGLLVSMCVVDVVLWFLDHGDSLGLRLQGVGHEWLRAEFGNALGWAEFALIASLACDLLVHFDLSQASEAGKATRSLAATGAVVWMISFIDRTAWDLGWPLQRRGIHNPQSFLLFIGSHMIWTITLIQVTALTVATTRQASRVLKEMDREDHEHDLLVSPSDQAFGLLTCSHDEMSRDSEPTAYGW